MAVIRWRNDVWSPTEQLNRLQNEINDLFEFPFQSRRGIFDRASSPSLDLIETDDGFVVYCDLPGATEGDIDVSLASDVLTVKGERKPTPRSDKSKVYRNEMWSGTFQRTISIPSLVDAESVEAELKNGVLRVYLPKREEIKPKQIELKVR